MSRGSFPGLGFDPTPGELSSVGATLDALQNAAQLIGEVSPRLADAVVVTDSAEWGGSAAEEFSDHGDDLPQGLNTGMAAISTAGAALAEWFGQMAKNQRHAEELEAKARKLQNDLEAAEQTMHAAGDAVPMVTNHPDYARLKGAWNDAVEARDGIAADLDALIARAHRLEAKHAREADAAADAVRSAQSDDPFAPEKDGFGPQVLDEISKVSGEVAKWSATAATVAAFVPGGQGVAAGLTGVSAVATGVNVASSIGQKAVGSSNAPTWGQIALAAVPAKTAGSAAKGLAGGYKAAKGQSAKKVAGSVARRGADGARKGFTRNNTYAKARKSYDDVQRSRQGLEPQHTPRTSGKQAAAAAATAPLDAAESAANIANDDDRKQSLLPRSLNNALGFALDPSFDRAADIAKSEASKHADGDGRS